MTLWIISGARSQVGKTHVAKQLCAVLPMSVYAKLGHGPRRAGKSPNYFNSVGELKRFLQDSSQEHEHVVLEANTNTGDIPNSIRVFLSATADMTNLRADARELQAAADICICRESQPRKWHRVLKRHVREPRLVQAVLAILADQQRRAVWRI